jgi:PPOX class probable FMN-dependent enzyme
MPEKPDLSALYAQPSEMIQKAVFDRLADVHKDYLKVATFFCIATGSPNGLDASPRGGPPGFVHVLDPHTIAFADWPGNNRIESMHNLELDDRVGMVFLFPGLEIFMRINGRATTVVDPLLLEALSEANKTPKTAMLIRVEQVIMHCGKAINRAKLWDPNSLVDRTTVPSIGKMLTTLMEVSESQADHITTHYEHSVRNDLY